MRFGILVVLLMLAASAGYAQETTPDTTDWRQYYPLQVGNTWEWYVYVIVNEHTIRRWEIVSDTLIDGRHYFVQQYQGFDTDFDTTSLALRRSRTAFLRYDTSRTRVVSLSTDDGTEVDYTCDLAADFGAVIDCSGDGLEETRVEGGYTDDPNYFPRFVDGDDVPPISAIKSFSSGSGVDFTYANGFGMVADIGDGASGTVTLVYAKLDGIVYGSSIVATDTEEHPVSGEHPHVSIYPNPASATVTIHVRSVRPSSTLIEIINTQGRRMKRLDGQGTAGRFRIDVSDLPAGLYFAKVTSTTTSFDVMPFVVVR